MQHDSRLLLGSVLPCRARLLLVHVEQFREPTRAALALRASLGHEAERGMARELVRAKTCARHDERCRSALRVVDAGQPESGGQGHDSRLAGRRERSARTRGSLPESRRFAASHRACPLRQRNASEDSCTRNETPHPRM